MGNGESGMGKRTRNPNSPPLQRGAGGDAVFIPYTRSEHTRSEHTRAQRYKSSESVSPGCEGDISASSADSGSG